MYFHAIEEALHNDNGTAGCGGNSMHIENNLRLGETWWDAISRLSLIQGASAIGDQLSFGIVDWNDQSAVHQPRPGVKANAKLPGRLFSDSPVSKVGMPAVDASQLEVQGRRNPSSFRNQFLFIRRRSHRNGRVGHCP